MWEESVIQKIWQKKAKFRKHFFVCELLIWLFIDSLTNIILYIFNYIKRFICFPLKQNIQKKR